MRKSILSIVLVFLCVPIAAAQTERNTEFFGGYSVMRTDYEARQPDPPTPVIVAFPGEQTLHGVNVSVTHYLKGGFGITGDFSWNSGKDRNDIVPALEIDTKIQVYNFLGGAQYKFNRSGKFSPFAHVLAGAAHTRVTLDVTGIPSSTGSATDFAMAMGGGLDIRVNERFAVRAIQADYNPIFMGDGNQLGFKSANNFRLSFGIVFR